MSRVTKKYQISIPKRLADAHGITPGDDLSWEDAGGGLRLTTSERVLKLSIEERLRLFDESETRRLERDRTRHVAVEQGEDRGWTRESLYDDRTG